MRPLSAIDAIGPAWTHTRRLLISPRRAGLLLKVGAVAVFAQMGGCNSSFNTPGRHVHGLPPALVAGLVAAAVALVLGSLVVGLALFYIGSRLQFVLFEVVLRSDTKIGPIWGRYGAATWRWMGLKILFFILAVACVAPFLVPFILHFIHNLPADQGAPHDVAAFVMAIFGFIAAIFFLVLLVGAAYVLLCDFGLPSMALESTTLGETVARVFRLIRAEPGQVLLFVIMRFVLGIVGVLFCEGAIAIGTLIALVPLGGAGFALWAGLHHASLAGHVVMVGGWVVLGTILATLIVVAGIMLLGYVYAFLEAYALYFLGGRYPMLGAYLEPFMAPPGFTYSVAPLASPPTQL